MTESEWWSATDSLPLIDWLFFDTPATDRKFRFFAVACCYRLKSLLRISEVIDALVLAERFADGLVPETQASAACLQTIQAYQDRWGGISDRSSEAEAYSTVISVLSDVENVRSPLHRSREAYESERARPYPWWAARDAAEATNDDDDLASGKDISERLAQVHLLHDIFGPLPFRDVAVRPEWLTSDVRLLAQGIYDTKVFDRMPILADALQDAGCDNEDVLNHCRAAGWEHVRGCWVIDLLLGRPWKE